MRDESTWTDASAPRRRRVRENTVVRVWGELGYNPALAKLELADLPTDDIALMTRILYMDQVQNLARAYAHRTGILR
jgi:hypothetical protein